MFAPDVNLDMDAAIQRLHGQNAHAAEMHTGVLTSKDWNKIWAQQRTEDHPRAEASAPSPPSKNVAPESSPSSAVSSETTGNESMTTRSATTNHATRQPLPSLDALAVPCQSRSDDGSESSISATTSSTAGSRATGTPASSIVSSTSSADDGVDQNQNQTLHADSTSEIDVAPFVQKRLRMAERPPANDAVKLKSTKRGLKRIYEDEDGNDKERPSTKRVREATAGSSRAQHPPACSYDSGMPGSSAQPAVSDPRGASTPSGVVAAAEFQRTEHIVGEAMNIRIVASSYQRAHLSRSSTRYLTRPRNLYNTSGSSAVVLLETPKPWLPFDPSHGAVL
ncbi:hypothetical protein AURDEDRAFT_159252 [Auricularia subglabra TFB-10046 SS5]|nr:hypothetical protein AURDEDRAFT_159252 [Auricularia subglabra TFB-10046 SS5]